MLLGASGFTTAGERKEAVIDSYTTVGNLSSGLPGLVGAGMLALRSCGPAGLPVA